jgi:hypothetical protein
VQIIPNKNMRGGKLRVLLWLPDARQKSCTQVCGRYNHGRGRC